MVEFENPLCRGGLFKFQEKAKEKKRIVSNLPVEEFVLIQIMNGGGPAKLFVQFENDR